MSQSPPPSPHLLFETINAFHKSSALQAAIELDLFTAIGQAGTAAAELARRCGCPERGVRILSDYLTMLGFLTKCDGRYALTPDSAVFLDRHSPVYLGAAARFYAQPAITEGFARLAEVVRGGGLPSSQGTVEHDHPIWLEFARSMGPVMTLPARALADLAPLPADRDAKVLDISASHGAFGLAFAQRHPRAHLVALDWEGVLALTEQNARAAGVGERFSKIAGDAFTVDLGSGYDLVLAPNFLHHFSPADCVRFLRRVHASLAPGGKVAIVDFVTDDDHIAPPAAAAFGIVMLGTTPEGDVYSFSEYAAMLAEAGFATPTLLPLPPSAESAILAER